MSFVAFSSRSRSRPRVIDGVCRARELDVGWAKEGTPPVVGVVRPPAPAAALVVVVVFILPPERRFSLLSGLSGFSLLFISTAPAPPPLPLSRSVSLPLSPWELPVKDKTDLSSSAVSPSTPGPKGRFVALTLRPLAARRRIRELAFALGLSGGRLCLMRDGEDVRIWDEGEGLAVGTAGDGGDGDDVFGTFGVDGSVGDDGLDR